MSIKFNEEHKVFYLNTLNSQYQIGINEMGILQHLYYGAPVGNCSMEYRNCLVDRGFSGNPYEYKTTRGMSLDTIPQEYTSTNVGDFRISSIELQNKNGSYSCDLRYLRHRIRRGKYVLPNLPYVRGNNGQLASDEEVDTLEITLLDSTISLEVKLYYGVFEKKDVITRAAVIKNLSNTDIRLYKAASMSIDYPYANLEAIHFHGKHCMERQVERVKLSHDVLSIGSKRGMSSHHNNPFVILVDENTTENHGDAYGFMMMYSGNHKFEIEKDFNDSIRLVAGINDYNFSWSLSHESEFTTPEMILAYTDNGLNALSNIYHNIIRENVIDAKYYSINRPVLINNWEATYFDFNNKKIENLIDKASELGIDMFVLDDGWFGKRINDNAGLGDWFVNEEKLKGGLKHIVNYANDKGLKFGLWFEPEMVNEDSDLYRAHPDWALTDPNRMPMMSRNQMVLDMSREDVQNYLFDSMSDVLESANIEYVKWDFNRAVSNLFSNVINSENQGELAHRFVLGTYSLLSRLLERFPKLMIEGCSGGGGRFDAGMLFFCPQIWTSDNTDPIARLSIQEGTSYGYPACTMGAHISASPNHQTGRTTSLKTREIVAQSGTFGYELDITQMDEFDKIKEQIRAFHKYDELTRRGNYYRLEKPSDKDYFTAWSFVAKNQKEALVNLVVKNKEANQKMPFVKMLGLNPDGLYVQESTDNVFTGAALMNGGFVFGDYFINKGDFNDIYPSMQVHFILKE